MFILVALLIFLSQKQVFGKKFNQQLHKYKIQKPKYFM